MKLKLLLSVKATLICTIIFSVCGFNAAAQEVIGLQKAVDLALERNLTIKQAEFTAAITNEDLKQSKYNQLPNLAVSPQGSFNFGRNIDPSTNQFSNQRILAVNGNFTSQVTLFQGGQLRNTVIQNKILLDADKTNVAKVKNDLILNVVTTYLLVLTNQDLVTAAQQQIDVSKIALDRAQKGFDVGNQTLADLSQAKAQLSTNDLNYTNAENQLEQSLLTLKQYMEMDPGTDIRVERPDISKLNNVKTVYDAQEVVKTALAVNPDVLLAEQRQKAAAQGVKIARGNYYPSVVLFGAAGSYFSDAKNTPFGVTPTGRFDTIGFVQNSQQAVVVPNYKVGYKSNPFFRQLSDNFNQSVGVSLQIPIFNRFLSRTAVRKAKLQNQNAEVTAQLARNNLSKIIYQAVWDLQAADKRYASATQTYNANKDAFNIIQQRYTVGLVNSLDYNTSLTNLNKSQFDMIEAQYQVIFRSKVIDYYLGNPITL
ncbi:TolC family protein [Mucilaginibacter rubeus]|uniref:TolC family protein n=1 Tax=Mucilaginibacter rubeus TaxID=2027860 RepID=A0AAE6JMR9_9SPHI|nr:MULTISPECIES: TolC family protein [Mucilaginibacter]QEM07530.1 TolC family protein [Mucilaginibacter rubeus]QEM19984.1 TolC family protein [Mucilaginibacter gossypii]QTE43308.1 TolC family protein [Mucilaginibacter rubeus]QTE49908.1 TolC family protein [Mucilaginibacter rubeus]QTE54999.1 TolC family protein [Mucilaginibacter rubeus]